MNIIQDCRNNRLSLIAMLKFVQESAAKMGLDIEGPLLRICKLAQVNRPQVYERKMQIEKAFERLELASPGRPVIQSNSELRADKLSQLLEQVYDFQREHPGSIALNSGRHATYSSGFIRFILDLHDKWDGASELFCKQIKIPYDTFRVWIKKDKLEAYDKDRPQYRRHFDKRKSASDVMAKKLVEIIHDRPRSFGINRSNWNHGTLALAYNSLYGILPSNSTVGRLLRKTGCKFKKARRVLTSPDPNYREKVEIVLNTLQNLKHDELFFFIDELGPLRIKKYGGSAIVHKHEALTFPQVQNHKGAIIMAGALCATTNQITWLYSPRKDAQSMIDLIEVLFNKHSTMKRILLTWDAASWHGSNQLVEWLDTFNADTMHNGFGPLIDLIPLPTSSQFIDVIESIFSGMKRAVIHHSDYQSENEMKTAISRHFMERNAYFAENPKRVGKKIWEVDFFQDTNNMRSGNYREW